MVTIDFGPHVVTVACITASVFFVRSLFAFLPALRRK